MSGLMRVSASSPLINGYLSFVVVSGFCWSSPIFVDLRSLPAADLLCFVFELR